MEKIKIGPRCKSSKSRILISNKMKHIKKKFLGRIQLPKGVADSLNSLAPVASPKNIDLHQMVAWGLNENDEFISMFQLKDGRSTHF
jgi:hypothetical protein